MTNPRINPPMTTHQATHQVTDSKGNPRLPRFNLAHDVRQYANTITPRMFSRIRGKLAWQAWSSVDSYVNHTFNIKIIGGYSVDSCVDWIYSAGI
jgi:hypothetical protein